MPISDINRNAQTTPTKTANYTISPDDNIIPMNATSGSLTATLYAAPGDGQLRQHSIYKTDSSANTVTVSDGGSFSFVLAAQNDAVTVQLTTGGTWVAIASNDYTSDVNQSTNISTANSAGVSAGTRASVADSKAVSDSINTSVAGSGVTSNSINISVAGSQNTSQSVLLSTLSTTTNSAIASVSLNLSVTTSTANSG